MPFLSSLAAQHANFRARYPTEPPEATWDPVFIPDPLEPSTWRERLWRLLLLVRLLGGMVRR